VTSSWHCCKLVQLLLLPGRCSPSAAQLALLLLLLLLLLSRPCNRLMGPA
jgi:hypothetical protein